MDASVNRRRAERPVGSSGAYGCAVDEQLGSLSPERVAAAVAPILDRLRVAIAHRVPAAAAHLLTEHGLTASAMQTLGMLRNTMPDRPVRRSQVFDVFAYTQPATVAAAVDELTQARLLEELPDDQLRLAEAGRSCLHELYGCMTGIVDELWAAHAGRVSVLAPLAAQALDAAADSGGSAFAVVAPVYEPPDASPAMHLAELLTPLRFHRFDAHIAAWHAAGLTVEEVQALPEGPQRDAIERETNRRAALPYAALSPDDRFTLVAGLGALPS